MWTNEFNPDQPRDEDGRWTENGTVGAAMIEVLGHVPFSEKAYAKGGRGWITPSGHIVDVGDHATHNGVVKAAGGTVAEAWEEGIIRFDVFAGAEIAQAPTPKQLGLLNKLLTFAAARNKVYVEVTKGGGEEFVGGKTKLFPVSRPEQVERVLSKVEAFYKQAAPVYESPLAQFRQNEQTKLNNALPALGYSLHAVEAVGWKVNFDPEQPRDEDGRFADSPSGAYLNRGEEEQVSAAVASRWLQDTERLLEQGHGSPARLSDRAMEMIGAELERGWWANRRVSQSALRRMVAQSVDNAMLQMRLDPTRYAKVIGAFAKPKTNAEEEGGRWVTMSGTPVFIKNGESPSDAMSRTFKDKAPNKSQPIPVQKESKVKAWLKEKTAGLREAFQQGRTGLKPQEEQAKPQATPEKSKEREAVSTKIQRIAEVGLGERETVAEQFFKKHVDDLYNGKMTTGEKVDELMRKGVLKSGNEKPEAVRERAIKDFDKAVILREQAAADRQGSGEGKRAYTDKTLRAGLGKGETLAERYFAGHVDDLYDGNTSVTAKVDDLIGKGELGFGRGDKGFAKMRETAIKDFTRALNLREASDVKFEKQKLEDAKPKKLTKREQQAEWVPSEEELADSGPVVGSGWKRNAFDPNQPRDPDGKWTGGTLNFSNEPSRVGGFTKDVAVRRSTVMKGEERVTTWHNPDGSQITDPKLVARAELLNGTKATAPNYKGAWLNPNLDSPLLAIAFDSKDRKHYVYSKEFEQGNAAEKFKIVAQMEKDLPAMREQAAKDRKAGSPEAHLFKLEDMTCIRVGSDKDTGAETKAYGLTTLRGEHVKVEGDLIKLEFPAKGGEVGSYEVKDRELAKFIQARKEANGDAELWPDVTASKFNAYLKTLDPTPDSPVTAHKFRHYHATRIATEVVSQYEGKELDGKTFAKVQKEACEKAAAHLSNTWTVTREKYVNPAVWGRLTVKAG